MISGPFAVLDCGAYPAVPSLTAVGAPEIVEIDGVRAAALDGRDQWLEADVAPDCTRSLTVCAWVRLNSDRLDGGIRLRPGQYAATAVSQEDPDHSPFYLGVRVFAAFQYDLSTKAFLRWTFTAAPTDGSHTGAIDWQHASGAMYIKPPDIDQWTFLVGVLDVDDRTIEVHVPTNGDRGTAHLPAFWPFWGAEGGLRVGQAPYLGEPSDLWPGEVASVRVYAQRLSRDDIARVMAETDPRPAGG